MNNKNIEKALQNAVNSAPPLSFSQIAAMPFIKMTEHDYITKQEERRTHYQMRQFALAAACCLLVLLSVSGWYIQNRRTDSIITLDVNPSIEILTNQKEKVIGLKALNEDAREIIEPIDYKNIKLNLVVQTLINSLVEKNYLNQEKNTILLTVINKKSGKADRILTDLNTTVRVSLKSKNIKPTILKQTISAKKERAELATKYHISEGRLRLIQSMLAASDKLTIDMLAKMNLEQLYQVAKEYSIDLSKFLTVEDNDTDQSKELPKSDKENDNKPKKSADRKEKDAKAEDLEDAAKEHDLEDNKKELQDNHKKYRNETDKKYDDIKDDRESTNDKDKIKNRNQKSDTGKTIDQNYTDSKGEGDEGSGENSDQDYDTEEDNKNELEASEDQTNLGAESEDERNHSTGNELTDDSEYSQDNEDSYYNDNPDDNYYPGEDSYKEGNENKNNED